MYRRNKNIKRLGAFLVDKKTFQSYNIINHMNKYSYVKWIGGNS